MVTAPKCKVCGSSHFGAAHVWPGEKQTPVAKQQLSPEGVLAVVEPIVDAATKLGNKPAFDRAAYQRDYMRRRRAQSS